MRAWAIAGLVCMLAACSPPAQAPGAGADNASGGGNMASSMQPGQYRTTVTILEMSIPGAPAQALNVAPTTSDSCVTTSDINEFTRGSMVNADSGETCSQNTMNSSGGHIQGDATCTGPYGARTMHITGNYTSTHVEMEIASTNDMPNGGGQMSQRMRIVTERTGDCAAGDTGK